MSKIKVSFLIINTLCGLVSGLILVLYGIAGTYIEVRGEEGWAAVINIWIGIVMFVYGIILLALAVLGYSGANYQNVTLLIVYTVCVVVLSMCDVSMFCIPDDPGIKGALRILMLVGPICHAALSLMSAVLSLALALQCRNQRAKDNEHTEPKPD